MPLADVQQLTCRLFSPKEIHCFGGSVANLKISRLSDSKVALAVSGPATPKDRLHNPEDDKKPHSTAKVYTSLYVRHWDSYVSENRSVIWYGCLSATGGGKAAEQGKPDSNTYTLEAPGLVNALAGTSLQSPVPPFGGGGDFDIGPRGLAFVSRDPASNPALYTRSDVYFVPLKTFTETEPQTPRLVPAPRALEGYAASPVFSPDGRRLVFTKMRSRQYESDKPRLLLTADIEHLTTDAVEFYATTDGEGGWDARPEGVVWSADAAELYVTAEKSGRGMLWKLPSDPAAAATAGLPQCLVSEGTVGEARPLGSDKLLLSGSSLVDNSIYSILDPASKQLDVVSSNSKGGRTFGLSRSQCDEIWFQGAGDYQVHALVFKPSGFDASKRYPLAFLIHGGPQGAWLDSWSTRWNPAVFAEQGYVVVCPNPTGSTGYGMALQDGIRNEWGGRPYQDLERCFDYIAAQMPYVDTDRAVAAGASYGGYMISTLLTSLSPSPPLPPSFIVGLTSRFERLDPRPAPGPPLQGPRVPRRRLQHARPVRVRGALLSSARLWRHSVGEPRWLRALGPGEVYRPVEHAAAGASPSLFPFCPALPPFGSKRSS